jgi:sugar phosphate isomerase/epimerase
MKNNIGLQLYSLRDKCEENLEDVFKEVSNAGYDGVEFYSFYDIAAEEMKSSLKNYGLKSAGTHTSVDMLKNNLDDLIRYNYIIESQFVGLGYFTGESRDEWLRLCEILEKAGERLRENGLKLLYHNHAHEFTNKYDGLMAEEIILGNTSPENVSLELDCYWVTFAGLDPKEYLKNNMNRVKTIHLKDMDEDKKMTEVGNGIIDCPGLYNICSEAGLSWVIIEQDEINIDKFESIRISINNLKQAVGR